MTDNPELNKLYYHNEVPPGWYHTSHGFQQYPVPTEIVILEPKLLTPVMGRVYGTFFSFFEKQVLTYDEIHDICWADYDEPSKDDMHWDEYQSALAALEPQRRTVSARQNTRVPIYCTEVFTDTGSDGHIEYELVGFKFILETMLDQITWARGDDGRRGRRPSGVMFRDGYFSADD